MKIEKLKNILFYGSIQKSEYDSIKPLVWKRNRRILSITSLLAASMGALFMVYALLTKAVTWFPYLILLCGSVLVFILSRLTLSHDNTKMSMVLCYGQMLLTCIYAGILSVQISNYGLPATSIVVFISLLPLAIDDNLVRMFAFILTESVSYLTISYYFKDSKAFSLDVMNMATFCVVGMALYAVISTRNIREIYQGVRIESIQKNIISSMATVVEERDESTGGHIARTEHYVRLLIKNMRKEEEYASLPEDFYTNVLLAAPMHDIGKIKISDSILNKPGKLTDEEFAVMKRHSEYGADIIGKTMQNVETEDYFTIACNIARYHHERFDGNGYPDGLKGEDIPLEARMMALADVYDALVSERVYKKPYSKEKARQIIEDGTGSQFDPKLTRLFLKEI